MKFLKIEKSQGFYAVDENADNFIGIDQLSKEDLLKLIDLCIKRQDFEMDPYDENILQNKAHQIIYKNIYLKLDDLKQRRVSFTDEKTVLYREAIEKYSVELSEQAEE